MLILIIVSWYNSYKHHKSCKKEISKELFPVAWYPRRWWDWSVSEDEKKKKKEIEPFLINEK